ncbi:MAG: TrmH family RNA methyltransferase [Moorellales bacterium]
MLTITSPDNPRVRLARALIQARERKKKGCYRLEGTKLVATALESGAPLEYVLFSPAALDRPEGKALRVALEAASVSCYLVAERLWSGLSSTSSPQGVLAVVRRQEPDLEAVLRPSGLFLALDGIQDPGNAGTLVRTAAAAGCQGVVALTGTTDLYADKCLRAAAGTQFYLPVITGVKPQTLVLEAERRGLGLVVAVPQGGVPYYRYSWNRSLVLVVGNEGQGPRPEMAGRIPERVTVPMWRGESLNVAVAAAVMLFEAARQRTEAEPFDNPSGSG